MLILGRDLAGFLQARRAKNKRPCAPGELYCVRCRGPQKAAGGMADCRPSTATLGNLIAICPVCENLIYRRVSLAKLEPIRRVLKVTMQQALPRIDESPRPSVSSAFNPEAAIRDDAQPH
jgi:hypothetical protein